METKYYRQKSFIKITKKILVNRKQKKKVVEVRKKVKRLFHWVFSKNIYYKEKKTKQLVILSKKLKKL